MSQYKIMLKALQEGKTLTRSICTFKYKIFESPARITEMRKAGIDVHTKMVSVINASGKKVRVAHWKLEAKAVA
jgi:hypothetical protein